MEHKFTVHEHHYVSPERILAEQIIEEKLYESVDKLEEQINKLTKEVWDMALEHYDTMNSKPITYEEIYGIKKDSNE